MISELQLIAAAVSHLAVAVVGVLRSDAVLGPVSGEVHGVEDHAAVVLVRGMTIYPIT